MGGARGRDRWEDSRGRKSGHAPGVGEVDAQRSGQQREELVEAGHGTRTRGARGGARVRVREAPV